MRKNEKCVSFHLYRVFAANIILAAVLKKILNFLSYVRAGDLFRTWLPVYNPGGFGSNIGTTLLSWQNEICEQGLLKPWLEWKSQVCLPLMKRRGIMTIYKPTPGKGFFWSVIFMIFVTGAVAAPLIISTVSGTPRLEFQLIMGGVLVLVLGIFGYLAWTAKNLTYEINKENMTIKWAFNRKTIPLTSIKGINRVVGNSATKVVGASLPGLHIGSFTSPTGKGSINLFATRLWGEILLIRTKWELIGITPENPEEYLEELSAKVPGLNSDGLAGLDHNPAPFSPWQAKHFLAVMGLTAATIIGTGIYLLKTIPALPAKIPMHYDFYGQVNRYGSPSELWVIYGIGVGIVAFMIILMSTVVRNNRTSAYLMAYTSLFIAILFSVISIAIG
ncbi:MAG: PH domain-containing protein [Thermincola sp.]|nr:PH domain-containing protein [Thermincola sp.]